jgi:hypothetical protein
MQSLPLEAKVLMTQHRIRAWYQFFDSEVYISFSGGKDSTVLLDIARKLYSDIEAVFIDTGLEYPEIRDFVKTIENVTWLKPSKNFRQVVLDVGYPVISKEVSLKIEETRSKPDGYASQSFHPDSIKNIKYGVRFDLSKYKYLLDAPFLISNKCCNVMKKKPRPKNESFFAHGLSYTVLIQGVIVGLLTLFAYSLGLELSNDVKTAQTMTFLTLSSIQLFHAFNIKSDKSVFSKQVFDNKYLWIAFIVGNILQFVIIYVPYLAKIFDVVPLSIYYVLLSLGIAFLIVIILEIVKIFDRRIENLKSEHIE